MGDEDQEMAAGGSRKEQWASVSKKAKVLGGP
jgi:hypothetical protein